MAVPVLRVSVPRWERAARCAACALGIIISFYAFQVERAVERDSEYRALCDLSDWMQCSRVFSSRATSRLHSETNGFAKEQDDSSDDMKKVQRREKNRIAAQKSRQRQTQKADTLHLESEDLERENSALRKEVRRLTEEAKYFSSLLSAHEALCSILPIGTPEDLLGPRSVQPHINSSRYQH